MKDFNEISQRLTQSKAEVMQDHLKKSNYIFKVMQWLITFCNYLVYYSYKISRSKNTMIFFLNERSDDCFQMYKAILLIPDVFNHKHTKLLANLLLERLGFGSAILHQVCTSVTLYQRFFCAILQ